MGDGASMGASNRAQDMRDHDAQDEPRDEAIPVKCSPPVTPTDGSLKVVSISALAQLHRELITQPI